MIIWKEKENIYIKMENIMKVVFQKIKKMEMEIYFITMEN